MTIVMMTSTEGKEDVAVEDTVTSAIPQKLNEALNLKAFVDFIFKKRALIQKAQTRWLTYVGVVERCVIWREPLMAALDEIKLDRPSSRRKAYNTDWAGLRISEEEGSILQQFLVVGRACKKVLESLEGANHTTISSLLWHHSRLLKFFTSASKNTSLHPWITLFCQKAIDNSAVKFNAQVDRAAMIGTVLDPRFKSLSFLTASEAGKCTDALNSAYIDLAIKMGDSSTVAGPPKKKSKRDSGSVFSDFTSDIVDTVTNKGY